jgi:chromosome segregation ATPase
VEEIHELRQAAAALDQRIADQRDWGGAIAERRRDLANAEAGSAGKDRQKLETIGLKLRIDDLEAAEAHLNKLNVQRPKLIERERILGGELSAARALITEKQKDLVTARQELRAAQSGVEGYSRELLSQLLDEQSQFASRLIKAEQEMRTLDADIDGALADASGALEIAEREHRAAEAAHREIAEELRKAKRRRRRANSEY